MGNDPVEKAKASLGEAWRAARHAAEGVKKEIERAGIARSIEDAGREIARATTSVASHLGAELEELGREIRVKAEGAQASVAKDPPPGSPPPASGSAASGPAASGPAASGPAASGPAASGPGDGPPPDPPGAAPGGGGGRVRIAT